MKAYFEKKGIYPWIGYYKLQEALSIENLAIKEDQLNVCIFSQVICQKMLLGAVSRSWL